MATLRRPTRTYSFSDWMKRNGNLPPPGNELDGVLHDLRECILSTQDALGELRRDDGRLRNATVGAEQLQPALITNITGDVTKITSALTDAVARAISANRITVEDIALLAKDAEAAAITTGKWLSQVKSIEKRLLEATTRAELASHEVETFTTDSQNWAIYAQAQAENAQAAEGQSLKWAEYIAGPVVAGPDAPEFIRQSPYPRGLFYQPVEGYGGLGGLWSAKWWAIYCQQLVGWISTYYLGAWDHPPSPGESNPDTGQTVPDPLGPGSIYFNIEDDQLYLWTGEAWVKPFSLTGGLTSRFSYKATASQTQFLGVDLFGKTPTFDASTQHDVHVNGVKLVLDDGSGKGDYVVDHTTYKLTLLDPVTVNSIVQWDLLVGAEKLAPGAAVIYKMDTLAPDGAKTVFTLTYTGPGGPGQVPTIGKAAELQVVLDGIPQEPVTEYTATGATLTMVTAPPATSRLWVIWFKSGGPGTLLAAPPPPFTPATLGGLVAWVDAAQLSLADGAAVSSWPNLGSGPAPSIVGTPAPVFKTNMLNGKPVVRFTAGQGRLRVTHSLTFDWTLLYVVRRWGSSPGRAWGVVYPPSNIYVGFHTTRPDAMYVEGATVWGPELAWSATPPDAWKLYGADSTPSLSRFFINGVFMGNNTPGNLTGTWNISGYDPANAGETCDCDIAEVLLYNRALPDAERIQAQDYLRGKWGLT